MISDPYLMFDSAYSEGMLIPYCSSYTFSVDAFFTRLLPKKSVNLIRFRQCVV